MIWRSCLTLFALLSLIVSVPMSMYVVGAFFVSTSAQDTVHPGTFWITEEGRFAEILMGIAGILIFIAIVWFIYRIWRSTLREND